MSCVCFSVLLLLIGTMAIGSAAGDIAPGFAADFRSYGDSSIYRQRLPHRQQARSFGQFPSRGSGVHQLQSFRQESYGDYRQPYSSREEPKMLHREVGRGRFKDGMYKETSTNRALKDEMRDLNANSKPYKDALRQYEDDIRAFNEGRPFGDERRQNHDGLRDFRDGRPYREETRVLYTNDLRPFRDDPNLFRDDIRQLEGTRNFREEYRAYRDEPRHLRDERPFREESESYRGEARPFREGRRYKEESVQFGNEPTSFRDERPFMQESGPYRNEPMPFREESRPFKDELLFTEESQSLAGAQRLFNREHERRQPLSFGGHSNYLKFGNHGLGFASVPSVILPLQDHSSQRPSEMIHSTAATTPQSLEFSTPANRETVSSLRDPVDTKSENSVTASPMVRSTPGQSTSGNGMDNNSGVNQRNNENPFAGGSSSASTSGGTNATPKVVFSSGAASMSSPSMGITGAVSGTVIQPTDTPLANSLRASNTMMYETAGSYFPSENTSPIPGVLLNHIFNYGIPEKTLSVGSSNHMKTVPLVHHHEMAKYSILPEFKIPELTGIRQSGGTIDFVSAAHLPKLSYLNQNQPTIVLDTSYSADSLPSANYAQNSIQLDQRNEFSHLGQVDLSQIGQSQYFPRLGQLVPSGRVTQLGEFGQFGQTEETRGNSFVQGGLPLQLGGFGGIQFAGLSSNSEPSRDSQTSGLEIGKVSLNLQEPARTPVPTFAKNFDNTDKLFEPLTKCSEQADDYCCAVT